MLKIHDEPVGRGDSSLPGMMLLPSHPSVRALAIAAFLALLLLLPVSSADSSTRAQNEANDSRSLAALMAVPGVIGGTQCPRFSGPRWSTHAGHGTRIYEGTTYGLQILFASMHYSCAQATAAVKKMFPRIPYVTQAELLRNPSRNIIPGGPAGFSCRGSRGKGAPAGYRDYSGVCLRGGKVAGIFFHWGGGTL